jgi:hypothetical protein
MKTHAAQSVNIDSYLAACVVVGAVVTGIVAGTAGRVVGGGEGAGCVIGRVAG